MMVPMTYQQAIEILKYAVKDSHLDNQRHIDLTVVGTEKREEAEQALISLRTYMAKQEVSEAQVKKDLGIS